MTTFINTKIDKYRLAAIIIEYHIISKLILKRIIITNLWSSESFEVNNDIGFGIPIELPNQKNIQIGP